MPDKRKPRPSNQLLSSISEEDFALIESRLEPLDLPRHFSLEEPNRPITHVYFPDDGIASIVAHAGGDRQIEAGIIGREGITGIHVILQGDRSPHSTFMQVPGRGHRITADDLRWLMQKNAAWQSLLLRFTQAFTVQMAQTALANGKAAIDERLARWILMVHDRMSVDRLELTHEFVAVMLGVRRSGVTLALQRFEQNGLLRGERGAIIVLNRKSLLEVAGGSYGVPEEAYARLIGWDVLNGRPKESAAKI